MRNKTMRRKGTYGKSVNNIKKTLEEILKSIFSYDFILERVKVAPLVLEFSTEESDSMTRHLEIQKRLAHKNQAVPALVLSEFSGTFSPFQLGSGPTYSWIEPTTGQKFVGYTTFCREGSQKVDVFAGDPDTRDLLGDALTSGLLLYLRDINFTVTKTFDQGQFTLIIEPEIGRTTGSDMPRDEDPEQRIVTETIDLKIHYEEFVYLEAVPADVGADLPDLGIEKYTPVCSGSSDSLGTVSTNIPPEIGIGVPVMARASGGSGFYQFGTSNGDVLTADVAGRLMGTSPGSANVYVNDTLNNRRYTVNVTVRAAQGPS